MHQDASGSQVQCGGLGATGSREEAIANVFTNSTWPGLQNIDSNVSDIERPDMSSPNMLEPNTNMDSGPIARRPFNSVEQINSTGEKKNENENSMKPFS